MRQAADQSNPALSVPATQQLAPLSKQPGYTQLLISIFSQNVNTPFGFWLSIALKSHIYQYWEPSAGEADVLNDQDRAAVKQTLVQMLLLCPPNQKAQVVHAIGIVSVSDYPAKWPTLVQDLISKICMFEIVNLFVDRVVINIERDVLIFSSSPQHTLYFVLPHFPSLHPFHSFHFTPHSPNRYQTQCDPL